MKAQQVLLCCCCRCSCTAPRHGRCRSAQLLFKRRRRRPRRLLLAGSSCGQQLQQLLLLLVGGRRGGLSSEPRYPQQGMTANKGTAAGLLDEAQMGLAARGSAR